MSRNLSGDQLEEAREAFKLVDKNGTGSIMSKEAPMVMRAIGLEPSDDEITGMLEAAGDSMTFDTFLNLVGDKMNVVVDNEDLRVAFSVFDREGQELDVNYIKSFNICIAGLAQWSRAQIHVGKPRGETLL